MKFVYVLEDDPKFQKEIVEAILQVDPKIQVRLFGGLQSFVDWIRIMMAEGAGAIAKGGTAFPGVVQEPLSDEAHQLVLVVSKIEFLGVKQLNLLRKTRDFFIERKVCTKEDPTSIVLTAFDDPGFPHKQLEDRILNNIIFKPFDRLILLQHLIFAIDGRHPPSKYTIQNQKTTAVIEMLKDAGMEAISETGFVTRSDRPIEAGMAAKYYGAPFQTERHRSMIGISESCIPHPTRPEQFEVRIRYFAADPIQISNLRKLIRKPGVKEHPTGPLHKTPSADAHDIVVIDPDESADAGIGGTLSRRFENIKITHYENFGDFFGDLDPSQKANQKDLPKPFEGSREATLEISSTSGLLVSTDQGNGTPLVKLFGALPEDWKNKADWLMKCLSPGHHEKWKRLLRPEGLDSGEDSQFYFRYQEKGFLVRFVFRDKKQNGNWLLKFEESSKEDLLSYLSKNSKLPFRPLAIFLSYRLLGENAKERWTLVKDLFANRGAEPKLFLMAAQDYTDAQEREMATYLTDIFFKPLDRAYIVQKMDHIFSTISAKGEEISQKFIARDDLVKVANPVSVSQMSEAGFVMQYYRPITIGSFREIILWQPYEVGAPELLANCNFSEEAQGKKGVFNNHFVLFGMTDHFLKNIRVWIRNNYILSKEGS